MKTKYILLTAIVLQTWTAKAQINLPKQLQQPIELAIERSTTINNKQIDIEKSDMQIQSVKNKHLPKVEAIGGYGYLNNRTVIDVPGYELPITNTELFSGKTKVNNHANIAHGGVMATSVLYSGGQIKNGIRALKKKAEGDQWLMETDKDSIVLDVVNSFDKMKFIAASKTLIDDSNQRLKKEEERVNKAIENGLAVPFDRDKIKLARLELASKKTELEESENLLLEKLHYLTGMERTDIQSIAYQLTSITIPGHLTANDKQELKALESYKEAGEWVLKKEKGAYLPQVLGFASLSYTGVFGGKSSFHFPNLPAQIAQPTLELNQFSLAPNFIVGALLRWELFNGSDKKNKIKTAELNIRQLDNRLNDSRDKLNLLLLQKIASYRTQQKKLDLAHQKKKVALNSKNMAEKQYSQGLISITERLEAENDYIKAGQEVVEILVAQRQTALETMAVTGHLLQKITFQ